MVINIKWRYSNTTFVKVKLITCIFYAESFCNSNTTFVKVKLIKWNKIMRKLYNSNTTFVKVK